jgi:hypothetical protein
MIINHFKQYQDQVMQIFLIYRNMELNVFQVEVDQVQERQLEEY